MITLSSIIFLFIVFLSVIWWQSVARARELATTTTKKMCDKQELQFLDGTVIQKKLSFRRDEQGRLGFFRRFYFDFFNGNERLQGHITVFKGQVIDFYLQNPLPSEQTTQQRDLFQSANETSNVIPFRKKDDENSE